MAVNRGNVMKKMPAAGVAVASKPVDVNAANLEKWRSSGKPRLWVAAHKGQWNHAEWLKLLEELKRSEYWPMKPESVGLALEEFKRKWPY